MTKISTISLLHDDTDNMHLGESLLEVTFLMDLFFPFPYVSLYWQDSSFPIIHKVDNIDI